MKMTKEQAKAVVQAIDQAFDANIQVEQGNASKEISTLELDLSVARPRNNPLKISFPFTSLLVEQATDTNTFVNLIPNSIDSIQDSVRLSLRDTFSTSKGIREAYITWDAQPEKRIVIKFFVTSKVTTGSLIIANEQDRGTLKVGGAEAKNDGFSVIRSFILVNNFGAGFVSFVSPASTGDGGGSQGLAANNASYDIASTFPTLRVGGAQTNIFKVPQGFEAEILGLEYVARSALTIGAGNGLSLNLFACKDGDLFNFSLNPDIFVSSRTIAFAQVRDIVAGGIVTGVLQCSKLFASSVVPRRNRIVLDENEFLFAGFSKSGAGTINASFDANILIRITPKVRAS